MCVCVERPPHLKTLAPRFLGLTAQDFCINSRASKIFVALFRGKVHSLPMQKHFDILSSEYSQNCQEGCHRPCCRGQHGISDHERRGSLLSRGPIAISGSLEQNEASPEQCQPSGEEKGIGPTATFSRAAKSEFGNVSRMSAVCLQFRNDELC